MTLRQTGCNGRRKKPIIVVEENCFIFRIIRIIMDPASWCHNFDKFEIVQNVMYVYLLQIKLSKKKITRKRSKRNGCDFDIEATVMFYAIV